MARPESHICSLATRYREDLWQCTCGQWWTQAPTGLLTFTFVSRDLWERLGDYRRQIRRGEQPSLAAAVRAQAAADTAERAAIHATAREDWARAQQAKRARAMRITRERFAAMPCTYCGTGERVGVDHVIPQAQGGTDDQRNLTPACLPCNIEKGGRTPAQWRAWRLARGRPWPPLPRTRAA